MCGGLLAVSAYSTGYIQPDALVPDIDGATYLGCFEDVRGSRTMEFAFVNGDDMTNEVRAAGEKLSFCFDTPTAGDGESNLSVIWLL